MDVSEDDIKHVRVECKDYDTAQEIQDTKPEEAMELFHKVVITEDPENKLVKLKEESVYHITRIMAKKQDASLLKKLLTRLEGYFNSLAKAKTAKIVRQVVEIVSRSVTSIDLQVEMCEDAVEWCASKKRTFLKQRMQTRLAELLTKQGKFKPAIKIISEVLKEVKKFDDKLLMVEVFLLESRVYYQLENLPKAKGALTSSRSCANAVYCPPLLQAQIDLQAGTLCAEEKDFKTAFSYFYEAFEGYQSIGYLPEATASLKYMLLTKIIADQAEDVYGIVHGKAGVKFAGREVQAMKEVADAHKKRSIHAFQEVFEKYRDQLEDDPIIKHHLQELRENLLHANLIRLIEPFSRVQISHVAKLINLDLKFVEQKLSEMILDKKFHGILDQGTGDLIIFDTRDQDKTYEASIATIKELSGVVDRLYIKAKHLSS